MELKMKNPTHSCREIKRALACIRIGAYERKKSIFYKIYFVQMNFF